MNLQLVGGADEVFHSSQTVLGAVTHFHSPSNKLQSHDCITGAGKFTVASVAAMQTAVSLVFMLWFGTSCWPFVAYIAGLR